MAAGRNNKSPHTCSLRPWSLLITEILCFTWWSGCQFNVQNLNRQNMLQHLSRSPVHTDGGGCHARCQPAQRERYSASYLKCPVIFLCSAIHTNTHTPMKHLSGAIWVFGILPEDTVAGGSRDWIIHLLIQRTLSGSSPGSGFPPTFGTFFLLKRNKR